MTPKGQLAKAEAHLAEATAKKIDSQRKQSWVVFGIGTFILFVTVLLPVASSLAPLLGWGCKDVVLDGVKQLLCAKVEPPWGFTAGLMAGVGLYLAAAAFRQVEIGQVGARWLDKLPGFKGKGNGE